MELARIWLRLSPACHFCSRRGWGTGPEAEEQASLNRVGENAEASNQLPSGFRAVSNVSTLQPRDSCAQPSGRQGFTCTFLFYTPLKTLCSRGKDYALGVFHFQMFLQRAFASRQHRSPTEQASSWGAPCKNRASTLKSELACLILPKETLPNRGSHPIYLGIKFFQKSLSQPKANLSTCS